MKKCLKRMMVVLVAVILSGSFVMAAHAAAKETARDGRFIAYDNGTVLDTKTNLMWAAKDNGSEITWSDAQKYCENYRGGDYTDWRMPTIDELSGLYDSSIERKFHLTKLIKLSWAGMWSSEPEGKFHRVYSFMLGAPRIGVQPFFRALPVRSAK